MAIRTDVSINWEVSPRIITVSAPSTEITMQDLYDTLRDAEIQPENMDDTYIVSGAGKENLGGGVYVGLTITLNNALISFDDRPGPTYVQCKLSGGNLVAVDASGNTLSSAISPTQFTQIVLANSTSASIIGVDATSIQYAVWDASVSQHQKTGSTGKTLSDTVKNTVNKIIPFIFSK